MIFDSFIKLSSDELNTLISGLAKDKQDEYKSRLNYELDQIKKMGFSSYFLIVYDFISGQKIMMSQLVLVEDRVQDLWLHMH